MTKDVGPEGQTGKMREVAAKGRTGEADITDPKVGVKGPVSGKTRFPDKLTETVLEERKNVARQGWTAQLKDFAAIAEKRGIDFVLKVRPGAKISLQLRAAEAAGKVIIQELTGL
jgi:hypothetical protein